MNIGFIAMKLAMAFDKYKIIDRETVHLLITNVEVLELDLNNFVINRSSIRCNRKHFQGELNENVRRSFVQPLTAVVVHW